MKSRKLIFTLTVFLLFVLALNSCAAPRNGTANEGTLDGVVYDKIGDASENYGYDSDYAPSSDADIADTVTTTEVTQMNEKIIHIVTINAQTKEYDSAVSTIRSAVVSMGGFEETFRSTGKSFSANNLYSRSAYMVLRIPAAQLDAFLGQIGDMVNVLSQNLSAQNVTSEYYDIEARLSVLESERTAYEEMLKQSKDIEYLLQVEDRLYDVIQEIEVYKTRLKLLDSKVSYSTVTISLDEVVEYTPVVIEEPSFGQRIAQAFSESWKNFAAGCQNFAVWFVYALPTILILAIIAFVIIAAVIGLNRKHRRPAPTNARTAETEKSNESSKDDA